MKDLSELKSEIESILFAAGRKVELEDLKRMCSEKGHRIKEAIKSLKMDYDMKNSSLAIMEDAEGYKLTVREKYLPLVENIVTETELPKSVMETLAVIAFKYPILQSDLVKIRSNKCYDHLSQLEEAGFIRREKHGRTNTITLTQKFFDYFELPPGKVKEAFASFEGVAKAIEEKEKQVEAMKEHAKVKKEEKKEPAAKLEVFDDEEPEPKEIPKIQVYDLNTDKLGDLQVVDESDQMPEEDLPDEKEASDDVEYPVPGETPGEDMEQQGQQGQQEQKGQQDEGLSDSSDESKDEGSDKAILDDYNVSDDSTTPLWQPDEGPDEQKDEAEDSGQDKSEEDAESTEEDASDEDTPEDTPEDKGHEEHEDEPVQDTEGPKDYFEDEFSEEDMSNKSADEKAEYNLKKKVYDRANSLLNPEEESESEDNREKELDSISEELQESKDKLED